MTTATDITFTAPVELTAAAGNGKLPRFTITAYSGSPMQIGGFGYPIIVDLSGIKAAKSKLPILLDHDPQRLIGQADSIKIDSRGVHLSGIITGNDADTQKVVTHAKNGFEWQASIGASIDSREIVDAGKTARVNGREVTGPVLIARKSTLRETSFVVIGADSNTAAKIAAQKGSRMETTETTQTPETFDAKRIDAICAGEWSIDAKAQIDELRIKAISGEMDLKALSAGVLEVLRSSRPAGADARIGRSVFSGKITGETRQILTAAALIRIGQSAVAEKSLGANVAQQGADLRCTHALDLVKAALMLEGRDVPSAQNEMIRAAFSTTSLPVALSDSAHKIALSAFTDAPATWRLIARRRPVVNFKATKQLRPYHADGAFEQVGPDGELKHSQPSEESFTDLQAKTYGKMFSVTRTDIINDDLGVINDLSLDLGLQGARTISDEVGRVVLANVSSFFGAGNGNYQEGAGTVLGIDSFSAAIQLLREQTDPDDRPIDIQPAALWVPPALEATGRQLLNSTTLSRVSTSDQLPEANPWASLVQLAVESRLASTAIHANASSTAWYIFANPGTVPAVTIAFLNGVEAPTVETAQADFNTLGVQWRGYIDFGVTLTDPRGAVKSKGAA